MYWSNCPSLMRVSLDDMRSPMTLTGLGYSATTRCRISRQSRTQQQENRYAHPFGCAAAGLASYAAAGTAVRTAERVVCNSFMLSTSTANRASLRVSRESIFNRCTRATRSGFYVLRYPLCRPIRGPNGQEGDRAGRWLTIAMHFRPGYWPGGKIRYRLVGDDLYAGLRLCPCSSAFPAGRSGTVSASRDADFFLRH